MLNASDKWSSYSQQLEIRNNVMKEILLQLGLKREVFQTERNVSLWTETRGMKRSNRKNCQVMVAQHCECTECH